MIGQENLAAVQPPIFDKSGRKKYCMKNMNFPLIYTFCKQLSSELFLR
jgi:hypothetical protein